MFPLHFAPASVSRNRVLPLAGTDDALDGLQDVWSVEAGTVPSLWGGVCAAAR